jgi:prolyl-tRNA editing enzyme YbaK/EbsC (Cys-tRNA(Pro) deacylase)
MAGDISLLDPRVADALAAVDVPFDVIACDEDKADTEAFCAAYGYELSESANTIVVVGKREPPVYAACVLLATHRLDVNRTVKQRLGTRKASFAPSDASVALTGQTPGGITPLGLPADLPLWVDEAVMACPRVVIGGGNRRSKVLAPPALLTVLGAEVVPGLANLAP